MGYASGSFPTGYFVGRLWNVDVRKHGSGRTGGTNVLRSVGWGAFALTVFGDIAKGVVPVLLARLLFPDQHTAHALTLLAVLVGHNWSILIAALAKPDPNATYGPPPLGWVRRIAQRGRGGAGVGTTAGAALALFPPVLLVLVPIFVLVLVFVRYASVASLTVAALFPVLMLIFAVIGRAPLSYVVVALIASITIILVHIPNIQRLRAGTERRFGQRLAQRTRALGR
jgi:glycerol-3-phosphate acyltransferase PlsY